MNKDDRFLINHFQSFVYTVLTLRTSGNKLNFRLNRKLVAKSSRSLSFITRIIF